MRVSGEHPRDGEQYLLGLKWESEPWEGWTPRSLTRCQSLLFLRPEPPSHEDYFDSEQLELWPVTEATLSEGPRHLPGAPLLSGGMYRPIVRWSRVTRK